MTMKSDSTILGKVKEAVDYYKPSPHTKKEDWLSSLTKLRGYFKGENVEWNDNMQSWFNRTNSVGSVGQGSLSRDEIEKVKEKKGIEPLCKILDCWIEAKGDTTKAAFTKAENPFKSITSNSHPALLHRIAYALFPDSFCNTITDRSMEELLRLLNVKEEIDELCKKEGYPKEDLWYGRSLILRMHLKECNKKEDLSWPLYEKLKKEETYRQLDEAVKGEIKAFILYGAPGTGKTYMAKEFIRKNNYQSKIVQFHPNYTYEDFMGGISPKLDDAGNEVKYFYKKGVFMQLCEEAEQDTTKPHCLLIDEINRADLSSVFGELLLALEYRGEAITLGNSGKEFKIPENVIIIGTMNNVDKSLVNFDLALRRRFCFIKVEPNLLSLEDILKDKYDNDTISLYIDRCQELNDSIVNKFKLGKDYQIGQAYFKYVMNYDTGKNRPSISKDALTKTWDYHIEPLLVDEYLGTLAEDEEIKKKLSELKQNFIKKITK